MERAVANLDSLMKDIDDNYGVEQVGQQTSSFQLDDDEPVMVTAEELIAKRSAPIVNEFQRKIQASSTDPKDKKGKEADESMQIEFDRKYSEKLRSQLEKERKKRKPSALEIEQREEGTTKEPESSSYDELGATPSPPAPLPAPAPPKPSLDLQAELRKSSGSSDSSSEEESAREREKREKAKEKERKEQEKKEKTLEKEKEKEAKKLQVLDRLKSIEQETAQLKGAKLEKKVTNLDLIAPEADEELEIPNLPKKKKEKKDKKDRKEKKDKKDKKEKDKKKKKKKQESSSEASSSESESSSEDDISLRRTPSTKSTSLPSSSSMLSASSFSSTSLSSISRTISQEDSSEGEIRPGFAKSPSYSTDLLLRSSSHLGLVPRKIITSRSNYSLSIFGEGDKDSPLFLMEKEILDWRQSFRQTSGRYPAYKDIFEDKTKGKDNIKAKLKAYRDLRTQTLQSKTV